MGRPLRVNPGGFVYHVLNRANPRTRIFHDHANYKAFERVSAAAVQRAPMRLLG
ncbi:unnamed protein product, partial [marine sediment metagenome]